MRQQVQTFQIDQHDDLDKTFASLSMIDEGNCFCLPPLDLVTTSGSDDDDASSVSTLSSHAEDFDALPRSIFQPYWDKNGSRSSPSLASSRASHKRRLSKDLSAIETYEQCLSSSSFTEDDKTCNRRKIFGSSGGYSYSRSEPHLACARLESGDKLFRKSQSSSAICCKPRSCLRRGRYSFCGSKALLARSDASSSVSFKQGVEVVVYERPIEQHAQTGWSKLFV
ncbi:hypothetical protein MPSEU_000946200 [Mayamaea pseudoterrestris]|nr:hypothetical protein MPSEU_000946200 [Mayamaea pseudoterrestris]